MKKIIALLFLSVFSVAGMLTANAAVTQSKITIDGVPYEMKYSTCTEETSTCLNEYYKEGESGDNWSELFTVVYSKNINDFKQFSGNLKSTAPSARYVLRQSDFDILTFNIPYEKNGKKYIEQNVAKVTKASDGEGTVSMQYAKRHVDNGSDKLNSEMFKTIKDYSSMFRVLPSVEVRKRPMP